MEDWKAMLGYVRAHPMVLLTTFAGAAVGAALGVLAYAQHWLG